MKLTNVTKNLKERWPQVLMVFGALLLDVVVGYRSLVSWQASQTREAQNRETLAVLATRQQVISELTADKNTLSQVALLVDGVFPNTSSAPVVMSQIQQIASETGIAVSALQFAGTPGDKVGTIKVQAAVKGTYEQVKNFLRTMESSGRMLQVSSLRLQAVDQLDASGITATFDISSLHFTGTVPPLSSAAYFKSPEFGKLRSILDSYKIYTPQNDSGTVGKSNPFLP